MTYRTPRFPWLLLFVAAAALPLGACKGGSAMPPPSTCGPTGTVPPDLRDVERDGEGLVSAIFGAAPDHMPNWPRAQAVRTLLGQVWDRTKSGCAALPSAQVSAIDAALVQVDAAISAHDQAAGAKAANAVGLAVPELFAFFSPDIPTEVLRMDAVFRQVGIDAHAADLTAASTDVDSLTNDWNAIHAAVDGRTPTCHRVGGTATVSGDIDATLMSMHTALGAMDAAQLQIDSDDGALEVDVLELLYDCPPDGPVPGSGLGLAVHRQRGLWRRARVRHGQRGRHLCTRCGPGPSG